METAEFVRQLWFLPPLIWLTCALLWMIRGRFGPGSILGGLGFLLLFLGSTLHAMLRAFELFGDLDFFELSGLVFRFLPYTGICFLAGQVLILVGLATTRFRTTGAPAVQVAGSGPVWPEAELRPRHDPSGFGDGSGPATDLGPPAPLYRPGWTLTGSWIALSALAWCFGILALVLTLDAGSRISDDEAMGIGISCGLWFLTGLPAIIIFFVWLHRAWSAVPPIDRGTSPGKAVGYMFIPFFNIYWAFRAIPGLSASTRRAQQALDPQSPRSAAYGFGITAAVVAAIPYVNMLSWFFFLCWVIMATSDTNRLLRTRRRVEGKPGASFR